MQLAHKKFKKLKSKFTKINDKMLSSLWVKCLVWAWKVSTKATMINVWAEGVQEAIEKGLLIVEQGQFVKCGVNADKPAYFVGTSGSSIHLVHWNGSDEAQKAKFDRASYVYNKRGL